MDQLKHATIDGVRIHLKPQENKLIINGYYNLFLNDTTKNIISIFIDECNSTPTNMVVKNTVEKISKKYNISKEKAGTDFNHLIGIINELAKNKIPTYYVGVKKHDVKQTAPMRMDIALTYSCNNRCPHCYLLSNNQKNTLSTEEWKKIIDKLWVIGVPQLVFTGGECTLVKDLPELIEYSKQFTTGIISNGTNITYSLAKKLKDAELDWIQITLESHLKSVHDKMQGRNGAFDETVKGIKNCVKAGLSVSINATITQENKKDITKLIRFAKSIGVISVSTNAIINAGRGINQKKSIGIKEEELKIILDNAKLIAKKENITFNWFLPTCYNNLDPYKLGFGKRNCSACSVNMLIEPDGTIIPCQSWTHESLGNVGNILDDEWNLIWNNPLAIKIRNHDFATDKCKACDKFKDCGGGCPLNNLGLDRYKCGGL